MKSTAAISKKRLDVYKKKGYSSALEYRIDLMRDKIGRKFKTMHEYVEYFKKAR